MYRNVNADHLSEIFGKFGNVSSVTLESDAVSKLSKGSAYIRFDKRAEAETAQLHMHEGQIDGNEIQVNFVLVEPKAKRNISRSRSPSRPTNKRKIINNNRRHSPVNSRRPASPFRKR
jgi:RNA recognition motif-containing protein